MSQTANRPLANLSARKRKWFRIVAALLLPVTILSLAEFALRYAGYGYPTGFFLPAGSERPGRFQENPKFGWRFFPPSLARAPDPITLSKAKPAGTYRIFVFGESAALGDPEPAYGFSRILRELLEARCPEVKFEVINVAVTAISSHAVVQIARDCVRFQGDAWVIYMGNNEVVGPFGAGSVFGAKAPPMFLVRAILALKATRLGQRLEALWQRVGHRTQQTGQWEGMKMMVHEHVRASDPALRRVYKHFARNLTDILALAAKAGVRPIVCSVASNLKDCAPFASLPNPALASASQMEWHQSVKSGIELESRKEFAQALAQYRQAAAIDDTDAVLAFRTARCYLALGEPARAHDQYARARDLDVLRFRADSGINQVIHDITSRHTAAGVQFLDSEFALTNGCAVGITGAELFWDHVHLNFTGNYRLACALAEHVLPGVSERFRLVGKGVGPGLTEAECAERLAYTQRDQRLVLERMWRRIHEAPFTQQLDHEARLHQWSALLAEMRDKTGREGPRKDIANYRAALERRDDDWVLHHRFGYVLEAAGDWASAEREWKRVIDLVPQYVDAWFKLGDMSAVQSKLAEAEGHYTHVLQLRPNSFEALNGLGLVRMNQGQPDQAVQCFEQALRIAPQFAQAHVNWGVLCSQRGLTAEAEAHFLEALRCDPESAGAHVNLGNLLATQQKHAQAIDQYRKAIQLQPKQPTVHLSLANSLEAVGQGAEALIHFRDALRLDPNLADAHFNLAVALAKRGDLPGAARSFQEAVRLNPQDPQAHLSLGVALAQQKRLREAIEQFEAVLRLDPTNVAARQYLRTAVAIEQGRDVPAK